MGKIKIKENVQFYLFVVWQKFALSTLILAIGLESLPRSSSSKKVVAEPVINCNEIKETNRHADQDQGMSGNYKENRSSKKSSGAIQLYHWVRCTKGDDEDQKDKICETISVTSVSTTKSADVLSAPLQNFQMHHGHQPYNGG